MICSCTENFLGGFCQQKKAVAEPYVSKVSEILVKIGTYLNQTQVSIQDYNEFLFYKELLYHSIDFFNQNSVLAYSHTLWKIQPLAQTNDDVSTISHLYRRTHNYYWNKLADFVSMEDKTVGV